MVCQEDSYFSCRVVCARVCVCACACLKVCVHESPSRSPAARSFTVSMAKHCVRNGMAPSSRGLLCAFAWCDQVACAIIHPGKACPCLFMYELAVFRQMQTLIVMAVTILLIFFASLNDNGSARCFPSRYTSPDLVWDY